MIHPPRTSRALAGALGTAILLGATLHAPSAAADTRLIVNCFWPPKHLVCSTLLPEWLAVVEQVTEGRVRGIIPPKSVAPPPEQLASVEKGVVDAAVQFNGLIGNRVVGPLVAMNPFVGNDDAAAMSRALWEVNREYFADEFDTVELLTQWVISPGQLYSQTDTPVNSIDDLQSRKIWALPGPLADIMKTLGAGVVSTPAVQSNEIISRGVVDAHIGLDLTDVRNFQLMPYTKSITRFSKALYSTSFSFFVNRDKWSEIDAADREAIMAVSGAKLAERAGELWNESAAMAETAFVEAGITSVDADPAFEQALIEAAAPVTENWIARATDAGIDGKAALEAYQKAIAP